MLNACNVHLPKRFWSNKGGLEYPLTIATMLAGVAIGRPWAVQPGPRDRLAADRLDVGAVVVGGGLLAGLATVAARACSVRTRRAGGDPRDKETL
jgi:hypothetical protein